MTRDCASKECGKVFKDKRDLLTHEKSIHLKIKDHPCDQCDSAFSDSKRLSRHMRLIHTIDKVVCSFCGETFRNKHVLVKHIRRAHGDEAKYACDGCDKAFMTESGLQIHKYNHCGKDPKDYEPRVKRDSVKFDKVFPCKLCSKTYPSSDSLRRHHREKHENIRYPCPYCNKVYTQNVVKRLHIKREHTNIA